MRNLHFLFQKFEETHGEVLCIGYTLGRYSRVQHNTLESMGNDDDGTDAKLDVNELIKQALKYFGKMVVVY